MSVTVLRDGSRTVLYFGRGRKLHRVIAMRSRHLTVESLTDQQFASRAYKPFDGADIERALAMFKNHRAGVTDTALDLIDKELTRIGEINATDF